MFLMFVQEVYSGMVIGEHARAGDLEVRNVPQTRLLVYPFLVLI